MPRMTAARVAVEIQGAEIDNVSEYDVRHPVPTPAGSRD